MAERAPQSLSMEANLVNNNNFTELSTKVFTINYYEDKQPLTLRWYQQEQPGYSTKRKLDVDLV